MSNLYVATIIRDARGRTVEMRQPIMGEGDLAMMNDGPATYWTKVNSVAIVDGRPMPVEAMIQIEAATSPALAFLHMQATVDEKARPALEEEAHRLVEVMRKAQQDARRDAAGRIQRPG